MKFPNYRVSQNSLPNGCAYRAYIYSAQLWAECKTNNRCAQFCAHLAGRLIFEPSAPKMGALAYRFFSALVLLFFRVGIAIDKTKQIC